MNENTIVQDKWEWRGFGDAAFFVAGISYGAQNMNWFTEIKEDEPNSALISNVELSFGIVGLAATFVTLAIAQTFENKAKKAIKK